MGTAGSQQHQARLTLTLLVFLLQRLALRLGITLHCPHCKDEEEFFDYVTAMGIRIPRRLVSHSWFFRRECTRAVPALGRPQQASLFAAHERWPPLHGEAGNAVGLDEQGWPGSILRQGQWVLIRFLPFSGRGPIWDDNSDVENGGKHKRCNASECRHPHGRERAEEEG